MDPPAPPAYADPPSPVPFSDEEEYESSQPGDDDAEASQETEDNEGRVYNNIEIELFICIFMCHSHKFFSLINKKHPAATTETTTATKPQNATTRTARSVDGPPAPVRAIAHLGIIDTFVSNLHPPYPYSPIPK